MKRYPEKVSSLLEEVFRGHPLEARLREGAIWQVWREAVGEQIGRRTRPVKFSGGILTIAVSGAPWMQQLTFLKAEIIEKLNRLLPQPLVNDLFFKSGKIAAPSVAPDKPKLRPLSTEERNAIRAATATVEDGEVRAALSSLIEKLTAHAPTAE